MKIYISRDGNQQGPYSLSEISKLLESETITGNDLCWYEGCAEWIPLSQLPGFIPAPMPIGSVVPQVVSQTKAPTSTAPVTVRIVPKAVPAVSPVPVTPQASKNPSRRMPLLRVFILGILVGGGLGWKIRDFLPSSAHNGSQQRAISQEPAQTPSKTISGPPDDIIIRGASKVYFAEEPFRRGAPLVARNMKGIPSGTTIYPVKFGDVSTSVYYIKDEFGDWKVTYEGFNGYPGPVK